MSKIEMTSLSIIETVLANQQYFHKIAAFESAPAVIKLPIPVGGLGIGGVIQFNLRRTPTGDSYPDDAILIKAAMHVSTDDRGSKNIYNN